MDQKFISIEKTKVNEELYNFVNNEIIPETSINKDSFWKDFIVAANVLSIKNKTLIQERDALQKKIDAWHVENEDKFSLESYKNFLKEINYLVEEKENFKIETENVDDEISNIAGPQLVVPIDNSRYALNAANARWGSFYDALYGTDAISDENGCEKTKSYNPKRGKKVIENGRDFLNQIFPLEVGNWKEIKELSIDNKNLVITLPDKSKTYLKNKEKFIGYVGEKNKPSSILLKNNYLHILIPVHI